MQNTVYKLQFFTFMYAEWSHTILLIDVGLNVVIIRATKAEKLEGTTRGKCRFPSLSSFVLSHSPVIICPNRCFTHGLSALISLPLQSRSFSCRLEGSLTVNEKLESFLSRTSSSSKKNDSQKSGGDQIHMVRRFFRVGGDA